jgi:hypothetical protein
VASKVAKRRFDSDRWCQARTAHWRGQQTVNLWFRLCRFNSYSWYVKNNDEAQERLMRNPHTLEKLRQAERDLREGRCATLTLDDLGNVQIK